MFISPKSRIPFMVFAALALVATRTAPPPAVHRPMSIDNRLLLNRAVIAGLETLEVMLVVPRDRVDAVTTRVRELGGGVRKQDREIGYLRVTVPTVRLLDLVDAADIDAYQIATFSMGQWYRDGWPRLEADAYRYFDAAPPVALESKTPTALPILTPKAARAAGYTADDETGVGKWTRDHPTFDGRGVTIAILETGQPDFTRLMSSTAKTTDGRDVPKLAGIMNPIDPDARDETRVDLDTAVRTTSTWIRIGSRSYVLPRAGSYRFGIFRVPAGSNLVQEFGVLQDEQNGDIRVDTNGDASFQDETPIADVNDRLDVRYLKLTIPRIDLSFVIAHGSRPHTVHVYCGRSEHQTVALSVAAGSRSPDSPASGVAPGAQIVLVRVISPQPRLVEFVEGYLAAAARPDVDIITDSDNMASTPDTAADFLALLFTRVADTRGKLLFQAAGNRMLTLNAAHPADGAFSVGGSIGPEAFGALYGGGTLSRAIVHPTSAAGPSVDGGVKPDFLAPMQRLAASTPWTPPVLLPKNAPVASTGPGYAISCCTSSSSPYAAGVAALLLSGARQAHVSWTVGSFGRALRIGAQFLDDFPSYLQGNGVLDVNAAWSELTHPMDVPVIRSAAQVVHPLSPYAGRGPQGSGIFELGGWRPDEVGRRTIRLRRESGAVEPVTYRLDWTGNDGTFATAATVTLPLRQVVTLPATISASTPGVHSALLNVRETTRDRVIFRTQATIVSAERLDPATGTVHAAGTLPLMRLRTHYIDVPPGTSALEIVITIHRGVVRPTVVPSHTLFPQSEEDPVVGIGPELAVGSHTGVIAHPVAGMWAVNLTNYAAWFEPGTLKAVEAEYSIDVRLLRVAVHIGKPVNGRTAVHVQNNGSAIREPVLEASDAIVTSEQGASAGSGLPSVFEITVPRNASSLLLRARGAERSPLEMYLYDCTTGECFLQDFTIPASPEQILELRHPHAGQWRLAVSSGPNGASSGHITVDETVAMGEPATIPLPFGIRSGERVSMSARTPRAPAQHHAMFYELIDAAAERNARASAWIENAPSSPIVSRPSAGWAVAPVR